MDFFEKQAQAHRRTTWLVGYFVLAVAGIIVSLHVAFALILGYSLFDWEALGFTAAGVVALVFLGSTMKMIELSQGGRAVAAMLGGQPVDLNSSDPAILRLLNVVEEMSIASGVPVPEIFVLEEPGINAFAAGHGSGDAAIGVTRGCIDRLTRDELQGVIGHEFSHILHGDMKLNVRLIGVLHGIVFLAVLGGAMMRVGAYSRSGSSNDRGSRDGVSFVFLILALGVALYVIGWIGVFFGRLIKAAVSRQREFLADAAAVQYTRNPEGLAGALAKISRYSSALLNPRAEMASHMYFGNGMGDSWLAWMSTHPPIEERIAQIAPDFDLAEAKKRPLPPPSEKPKPEVQVPLAGGRLAEALLPGQPQLNVASILLAGLPEDVRRASREIHGAWAMVYSLLIAEDPGHRAQQMEMIDASLCGEVEKLLGERGWLSSAQRLALIDLAIPTLRQLSPQQYESFRSGVKALVEADGQIHLFEYTLQKILLRHLDLFFSNETGPKVTFRSMVPLLPDAGVILSALASGDDGSDAELDAAFRAGVAELLVNPGSFPLERTNEIDLAAFDEALNRFAEAAPDVKRTLLTAGGSVVMHDGSVNDTQIELLRAVADALDCPIPPFVHIA